MTDLAELASELSEAMKRMVLASEPGAFGRDDTSCGAEGWTPGEKSTMRALKRRGLGDYMPGYDGMCALWFNNDLGLALRAHLEADK